MTRSCYPSINEPWIACPGVDNNDESQKQTDEELAPIEKENKPWMECPIDSIDEGQEGASED